MSDSDYYSYSDDEYNSPSEEKPKKKAIIKKKDKSEGETVEDAEKKLEEMKKLLEYTKKPEIKELEKRINKEEILKGISKPTNIKSIDEYNKSLEERAKAAKITVNKRGKYKKHKEKDYLFVTINPIECTIRDLKEIIKRIENNIKICSYVFEQRGESDETIGEGKHIHIIIKKKNKPSYYKTRIISMLNKMDIIEDSNKVHITEITNRGDVEHYIQGKKTPEKLTKMEYTRKWRLNSGLKDIYVIRGEIQKYDPPEISTITREVQQVRINDDLYIIVEINNKKITIKMNDYLK